MAHYPVLSGSFSVAAGDFNEDCVEDLVLPAGDAGSEATVLLGNGDGTFGAPLNDLKLSVVYPVDIMVGDFNNDGHLDTVTLGDWFTPLTLNVLLGNGDGTFQTGQTYEIGATAAYLAVADVNRDGNLDVVTSSTVLLGQGDGTFKPVSQSLGNETGLALGDFNGDGIVDIASGAYTWNDKIVLSLGNGDGTFAAPTPLTTGHNSAWLVGGDFNRDGSLDIAFTVDGADVMGANGGSLSVLFGPSFSSSSSTFAGFTPRALASADFNLDGALDLVNGAAPLNGVRVTLGNGDGTFQPGVNYGESGYSSYHRLAVADFDRDGKPDVAVAVDGSPSFYVGVLLNRSH